jgi:hypothetical protein
MVRIQIKDNYKPYISLLFFNLVLASELIAKFVKSILFKKLDNAYLCDTNACLKNKYYMINNLVSFFDYHLNSRLSVVLKF